MKKPSFASIGLLDRLSLQAQQERRFREQAQRAYEKGEITPKPSPREVLVRFPLQTGATARDVLGVVIEKGYR